MTDRELLERAAKAAGYTGLGDWDDRMQCLWDGEGWNFDPLHDDGDALRLAVKLRLTIECERFDDCDYMTATPPHTHQGYDCMVDQDACVATRRAIVRAAAAMVGESA